jgi:hypothetical protein
MRRSDNRAALTDEVARFQADVRRLALTAVRSIIQQELDRKRAQLQAAQPRTELTARSGTAAPPAAAPAREPPPAPAGLAAPSTTPATPATPAPSTPPPPPGSAASPASPAGVRKRVPWTRETITNELATWMLSGTAIDATFVARHGPPGLVAAARRVFGRFEAALNVAGLHVSKLYPDGPPER